MGPIWGPPGSCLPQMGPVLVPWILLSGLLSKLTTVRTLCAPMRQLSLQIYTNDCWLDGGPDDLNVNITLTQLHPQNTHRIQLQLKDLWRILNEYTYIIFGGWKGIVGVVRSAIMIQFLVSTCLSVLWPILKLKPLRIWCWEVFSKTHPGSKLGYNCACRFPSTMRSRYIAVIFLYVNSWKHPPQSSPVRASYGVSFVSANLT